MRKVTAEGNSEAVVVCISVGENVKRFGGQSRDGTARVEGSIGVGSNRGLVAGGAVDQMGALAAHVSHFDARGGADLPLNGEVPFLDVAIGKVWLQTRVPHTRGVEARRDRIWWK